VHNVSQSLDESEALVLATRGNWRHAWKVGFYEGDGVCVWWRTSVNANREWVPYWWTAMLKLWEAKVVWIRGTNNRLVLEELVF